MNNFTFTIHNADQAQPTILQFYAHKISLCGWNDILFDLNLKVTGKSHFVFKLGELICQSPGGTFSSY